MYIELIFDKNQGYIWTAGNLDASSVWVARFGTVGCGYGRVAGGYMLEPFAEDNLAYLSYLIMFCARQRAR